MLNAASWALPVTFLVAVAGVYLILARTGMSDKGWERIDFLWIFSSAVTLYFLATGMLYEQARASGQMDLDNYVSHVHRGRDRANLNVATFCVGPSRRVLDITPEENRRFCFLNGRAATALTSAALAFTSLSTITTESGYARIPDTIVSGSGGQDAVVTNILWKQVHDEIGLANESAAKLKGHVDHSAFLSSASRARVVWMYIFALVIALRISKPIYVLQIAPRRSWGNGETGEKRP